MDDTEIRNLQRALEDSLTRERTMFETLSKAQDDARKAVERARAAEAKLEEQKGQIGTLRTTLYDVKFGIEEGSIGTNTLMIRRIIELLDATQPR